MSNAADTGVRDRLPARTNGGQTPATTAPPSPAQMVRQAIERQSEGFNAVMPKGVDADRFSRLVLTAIKGTPQLMECFGTTQGQTTVLLSAMQAAAVGLEPNTPTQDCWLLPRRNKGVMECQLSLGYRGLLKLARRSGQMKTVYAEVVRERDEFHWERGLEADVLEHRPYDGDLDPGGMTHAYAVARYINGGYSFIVLTRRDVEKRRAMSASFRAQHNASSPWITWPEEMWKKTALRALVPYLELSTEDARALAADETRLRLNEDDAVIEVDAEQHELGAGDPDGEEAGGFPAPPAPPVEPVEEQPSPSGDNPPADDFVPMTQPQSKALHALLKAKHGAEGDGRFPVLAGLLDREVTSTKEISKDEASWLIDRMQEQADHPAPEPDAA